MRSYVARLIAGTWSVTSSGCGLKSDSATSPLQPLLPLTVPRQNQQQQQRLSMKSGKPASLLLVALMILASATILPLPGLDAPISKDVSAADQGVLSGMFPILTFHLLKCIGIRRLGWLFDIKTTHCDIKHVLHLASCLSLLCGVLLCNMCREMHNP